MPILYRSDAPRAAAWSQFFARHAPDLDFRVWPDAGNLDEIEYLIAWQGASALRPISLAASSWGNFYFTLPARYSFCIKHLPSDTFASYQQHDIR